MQNITIDISQLYADGTDQPSAKLAKLHRYLAAARLQAGIGNCVTLTGPGPVWLYLMLAHDLHGVATELRYDSPVTGPLVIFDHSPY